MISLADAIDRVNIGLELGESRLVATVSLCLTTMCWNWRALRSGSKNAMDAPAGIHAVTGHWCRARR
jgi:hypothetical protein